MAVLFFLAFFFRDFLAIATSRGTGRCPRYAPKDHAIGYFRAAAKDPADDPRVNREGLAMADEIRAEMVANVWKVVKAAGDEVEEGDTLVILESMKMEIPVVAEADGVVQQIAVNEGDVVQEGDLIAIID